MERSVLADVYGHSATAEEEESLWRLSLDITVLLKSGELSDATIITADGKAHHVHRCVLVARSPFFRNIFAQRKEEALPVEVELGVVAPELAISCNALSFVLQYIYSGLPGNHSDSVCYCADITCRHFSCRPAVDFLVQVLYASAVFEIYELTSLFQRRLLDVLHDIDVDDLPMILWVAAKCRPECSSLVKNCTVIVAKSRLLAVTLQKAQLPNDVIEGIISSRRADGVTEPDLVGVTDKKVKGILQALDDIELVPMLLKEEGAPTLDETCALHYAVEHCAPPVVAKLINLGLANVNRKNGRGYTLLHVAARRQVPKIILALLDKGAHASEVTLDGRKPSQIARRLTKHADDHYNFIGLKRKPEELCIGILEAAERQEEEGCSGAVFDLAVAANDDSMLGKLQYLEDRVKLAKVLFPTEAKVAMDHAQVAGTLEFKMEAMATEEQQQARFEALAKMVETAVKYFPRCAVEVDRWMDEEMEEMIRQDGTGKVMQQLEEIESAVTEMALLKGEFEINSSELKRNAWRISGC